MKPQKAKSDQLSGWKKKLCHLLQTPSLDFCCYLQYIQFTSFTSFLKQAEEWSIHNTLMPANNENKTHLCLMIRRSDLKTGFQSSSIEIIPVQIMWLSFIDISSRGFVNLSKCTENLQYLTLHQANRIVSDVLEESFKYWRKLVGICFYDAEDDQIKAVIYKLRNIKELLLYESRITDVGATYISSQLTHLEALEIRQNKLLTNSGLSQIVSCMKSLVQFGYTSKLQTLNVLTYNIELLCLNLRKLKYLTIGESSFENAEAIMVSSSLRSLQRLQLRRPRIGNAVILKLVRNLRHLKQLCLIQPLRKEELTPGHRLFRKIWSINSHLVLAVK